MRRDSLNPDLRRPRVLGVLALLAAIFFADVPAPPPTRAGALPAQPIDAGLAAPHRPA